MPQFIYTLQPTRLGMLSDGPSAEEQAAVMAHVSHLEAEAANGRVLLACRAQTNHEKTFGIVILQADSEQEAEQLMRADPAVAQGVMTAELYPYRVAVLSDDIKQALQD